MKHSTIPVSVALVASLLSSTAFALDYQHGDDRYSDTSHFSTAERAAISVLSDVGAVSGNPDGTFAPDRTLNRAEFVKIAARATPNLFGPWIDDLNRNCFPDVRQADWFSRDICGLKELDVVEGNPDGLFHPERSVNHAEAVKILVELFGYELPEPPENERWAWYRAYMLAAEEHGVLLPGNLDAGAELTRGQMARLAAAFVAEAHGELDEYRDEEEGRSSSSSSSSLSSNKSSSRTSSSSSSRTSSSSSSFGGIGSTDPDTNLTVRSNFLLLGEVSPVVGAVDFFAAQEPIDVDRLTVSFASDPSSIQQVRVYAESDGRLLGTSFRDGSNDYEINIPAGMLILPHRADAGVYVRLLMKPADGGASGGQIVRIENIEVEGDGVWSNSNYTVTSTETFLSFETTPALITGFIPATSLSSSAFVAGPSVTLWDENVSGRSTDNDYEPAITSLTFRVAKSSDVVLSDAQLTVPDSGAETDCTVSSGFITCDNIPASVGTVDGLQRIRLIADIDSNGSSDSYLQVSLQQAGSATSAGDIEWTDGSVTYDWLPLEEPLARGIVYE